MKKFIKDPQICFTLGLLGFIITNYLGNLYVNSILAPIFILIELIAVAFMIRNYLKERKADKQGGKDIYKSNE